MPVFYRADTRSPEEIFKYGFSPRSGRLKERALTDKQWWRSGITFTFDTSCVSDANSSNVICMTTKFNSAPIFPVDVATSGDTYVYAIFIPEEKIFDLHAHQLEQAKRICAVDKESNSGYVAVGLCGYEAFTPEVKPSDIIAAVKCERSALKAQSAGMQVYATHNYKSYMIPFDRDFKVGAQVFKNKNFNAENTVETTSIQQQIIKDFETKLNQNNKTTSIAEAVIADGLSHPKTESLFMVHIRGGYIRSAIRSVFVSIYEGLKNLGNAILSCFGKSQNSNDVQVPAIVELDITNVDPVMEEENSILNSTSPRAMLYAKESFEQSQLAQVHPANDAAPGCSYSAKPSCKLI